MRAVIGVGTNIGDRAKNLKEAAEALALLPETKIVKMSALYETEPWGYLDQAKFLNAVILLETELSPHALLGACLGIEAGFGRVRLFKNGPRILDLDLLFYENVTAESKELTLPHPRISERAFVLVPLLDLFPEGTAFGFDIQAALQKVGADGIQKI